MEERNTNNVDAVQQQEVFRKKVNHYNVCQNDYCPLHDQCLRWFAVQYIDTNLSMCTSMNPRYLKTGTELCEFFRKKQRVVMKRGLRLLILT